LNNNQSRRPAIRARSRLFQSPKKAMSLYNINIFINLFTEKIEKIAPSDKSPLKSLCFTVLALFSETAFCEAHILRDAAACFVITKRPERENSYGGLRENFLKASICFSLFSIFSRVL